MLVLSRKPGESIRIGDDITVTVSSIHGGKARLAIEAPREIPVHREEIARLIASRPALATLAVQADMRAMTHD
jgi:carbon storage regulator